MCEWLGVAGLFVINGSFIFFDAFECFRSIAAYCRMMPTGQLPHRQNLHDAFTDEVELDPPPKAFSSCMEAVPTIVSRKAEIGTH